MWWRVPALLSRGCRCALPWAQELDARAHQLAEEKRKPGGKNGEEGEAQSVSVFKFDQSRAPAFSDDQIERDSELAAGGRRLML